MALTKITSTNIGANAVANSIGYTPLNKAGDSMTGGGSLDFVSSSNRAIVGVRGTGFGYDPTSYEVLQVGRGTSNESVAIAVDPSTVSGGSFTGNGKEVCFPNAVSFITPNSGGTDWIAPMRIDSAGRITMPLQPSMVVSNPSFSTGSITGGTVAFDVTSSYNGTNGRFTAPVTGKYLAGISVYVVGTAMCEVGLYKNGSVWAWFFQKNYTGGSYEGFGGAQLVSLTAGDYVTWYNNKGSIRESADDHRWIYLVG